MKRTIRKGLYPLVWAMLREKSRTYDEINSALPHDLKNENQNRLRDYIGKLCRAGFLERRMENDRNHYGRPTPRYYLINDIGPLPPCFRNNGQIDDPNKNQALIGSYNNYRSPHKTAEKYESQPVGSSIFDKHGREQWSPFKAGLEANPTKLHPKCRPTA